jgi:tripartite-type tricarboxylate transporter receptor subunit TctC
MKYSRRRFVCFAAASAAVSTFPGISSAETYPARSVRLILPLSAGSGADILARIVATKLSERWGQPVIVENRPGAGTTIGTNTVAKSAADGHTLLVNSAAFAASAAVYASLPYDPLNDLAPVSQIASAPIVLVTPPALGVKSLMDLIELAKQKQDGLNFGSAGVGSSGHFAGEQFKLAAGFSSVHVAYKGPAEALIDTMTGRIQYMLSPFLPALPFIRDGKLLALAVTTAQRSPLLPDVPTVAEAGIPDFEYQDWWGVFAPAGTQSSVVEKISAEIGHVLGLSEVAKQLLDQGAEARPSTPGAFNSFVRDRIAAARQVAASAKIQLN